MAVEIEAKMKVDDLEAVRNRLKAAGATLIGDFLEKNLFFDTDDRSLLTADEGLRLRLTQNLATSEHVNTITFKGPRKHGQLKSREETEVNVDNFDNAATLLGCLGYVRVLQFEKRRESWSFRSCKVELDTLPHLGTYVEIEGPQDEAVMAVREAMQLTHRPLVRSSYIAMLMNHLQESNSTDREVKLPPAKV